MRLLISRIAETRRSMSCLETNMADIFVSSRGQRSGSRRRVRQTGSRSVIHFFSGFARRRGIGRVKSEDVVSDPLRLRGGVEELALVLLQVGDPRLNVARMVRNVGRQADLRANEKAWEIRALSWQPRPRGRGRSCRY